APLTIELLREIAFNKSSRLVISTVNAWRAGMSKPIAIPLNAAIAMMNPVAANPSHTPAGSEDAQIICAACVITRMDLFGERSARLPADTDEGTIGAEPPAAT